MQVERSEEGQRPVGEHGCSCVIDIARLHDQGAQVAKGSERLKGAVDEAIIVGAIVYQAEVACIRRAVLISRRCKG